jgi:cytoskeletal protein RodZ
MVESVGKKLSQARHERGLTIDEAAHATKLRPDKIVALESDDYSRFANNIYAKGFLQIYGRFLKVDVSEFARTLDNANPISIGDYQYLSNAPATRRETMTVRREERRPPSLAPLFFFIALIVFGLAGAWIYQNYERIKSEPTGKSTKIPESIATPAPNPDAAFVSSAPPPIATPPLRAAAVPRGLGPTLAPHPPTALPTTNPKPLASATPPAKTPDQDTVTPTPVATADPANHPLLPSGVNEVLVAAVKKTWVTIRKDDPKAAPIFEDYVYPNANPLKLKGARFFIEARDPAAVQITKNGLPFANRAAGVPVQ